MLGCVLAATSTHNPEVDCTAIVDPDERVRAVSVVSEQVKRKLMGLVCAAIQVVELN